MAKKDKRGKTEVPERERTARAAIADAIRARPLTAREISRRTSLSEKTIADHLDHLARSLEPGGQRLVTRAAECLACAFVFEGRARHSTPGRCPRCKSERVSPPSYGIATHDGRRTYADGGSGKSPLPPHEAAPPGLDPAARSRDEARDMASGSSSTARDVILQVESAVSTAIFSSETAASGESHVAPPADAIARAVAAAREGKRAAAVLAPDELLASIGAVHAAAEARAPIVLHVIGGAPGEGPLRGRDEIAPLLDVGAAVLVAWSAQDAADLTLAARRAAEDAETPVVLVTDGGGSLMSLPGAGLVEKFLGTRAAGGAPSAATRVDAKRRERSFAARVPFAVAGAMRELGELTGRPLLPVERFETSDADAIVVAFGQAFPAAREAAVALRAEGSRVGVVGLRALRPFAASDVVKAVGRARAVAVVEPLDVALAPAGPLATALKAAFADALTWAPGFPGVGHIPTIISVVFATLPGAAVAPAEVRTAVAELAAGDRAPRLVVIGSDRV